MHEQNDPEYFKPIADILPELKPVEMKILFTMFYEGRTYIDSLELHEKTGFNERIIKNALKSKNVRNTIKELQKNRVTKRFEMFRILEDMYDK